MGESEIITCFNNTECTYTACLSNQFNQQLDTCNFIIIGLLKGGASVTKTPIKYEPQRRSERKGGLEYLEEGKLEREVVGILTNDPVIATIDTRFGPSKTAKFQIEDDTGRASVTLWGDALVKDALNFSKGSKITLTNMSVQKPYEGVNQISSTRPNPDKKFDGTSITS